MKTTALTLLVTLALLTPRSARAQSASTKAWEAVVIGNRERLDDLINRLNDVPAKPSSAADQRAVWGLELLKKDGYAEIAAACTAGKFKGEQTSERVLRAETVCPMVIDRKALLEKNITAWAVSYANYFIDNHARAVDAIEKSGRLPVAFLGEVPTAQSQKDSVTKSAARLLEGIGGALPADQLDREDAIFAHREEVIAKLVAEGKMPPKVKGDAAAEKHLHDVAEKKELTVVKVVLEGDDWKPVKNKAGVLLKRSRDAQVLVKSKVGKYCALIPAYVTQEYEAAGRYAKQYGGQLTAEATLLKCP